MKKYIVLEKAIGETPLACMENWRAAQPPAYQGVPLTYAGRLDPMASGKLLILIGEECKRKSYYNELDKEYRFSVLFDVSSDTGDVLGVPTLASTTLPSLTLSRLQNIAEEFTGEITLPYPAYSSKTVHGKPLHTWTLEGRLNEIDIPTKTSTIYSLKATAARRVTLTSAVEESLEKIDLLPPVMDEKKALGNDFRRPLIRPAWQALKDIEGDQQLMIADFTCIASSGTYVRTLASEIAQAANTTGLAWSIHRTVIGKYQPLPIINGFWRKRFN